MTTVLARDAAVSTKYQFSWSRALRWFYERTASFVYTLLAAPYQRKRLIYVFDYAVAPLASCKSAVTFREVSPQELASGRSGHVADPPTESPDFERGWIVGMLEGRKVYHASYVRADGAQFRDFSKGWRPSGRVLFLHDGFTEPEVRGRGVHSAATAWLLEHAHRPDIAHAVCLIRADNPAARRAVAKAGFRPVGRAE